MVHPKQDILYIKMHNLLIILFFSKDTIWSSHTDEYNYYINKKGKVIVNDAVNIHFVNNEYYDFIFS